MAVFLAILPLLHLLYLPPLLLRRSYNPSASSTLRFLLSSKHTLPSVPLPFPHAIPYVFSVLSCFCVQIGTAGPQKHCSCGISTVRPSWSLFLSLLPPLLLHSRIVLKLCICLISPLDFMVFKVKILLFSVFPLLFGA